MAPADRAKEAADRERRLNTLPSFRAIETTRHAEKRRAEDLKRAQERQELRDAPQRFDSKLFRGVDCRDCHPDPPTPRFDLRSFGSLDRPTPLAADDARAQIDKGFDGAAKGLDPTGRAALADGYAEKLAGPAADPNGTSRDRARAKESDKASDAFRLREADRMRAAAPDDPDVRQRADDLVRRPLTPASDRFLDALETTPADRLSKNDVDDGMAVIRRHRAADHDQYDRRTGLAPGNDDLFVGTKEQNALFDANRVRDLDLARDRLRSLTSKNCIDCHPDPEPPRLLGLDRFGGLAPTPKAPTERERVDRAIDDRLASDPRFEGLARGSEGYEKAHARLRAEHEQLQRIRADPSNPRARLKVDPANMTPEQQRVLADHEAAYRFNQLDAKLRGPQRAFDAEYDKNGWGEDSRFYGANDAAFLTDLSAKDPAKISRHDAFRGLSTIDGFRQGNPEIFAPHAGDFASRAGGSDLYYRDIADIRRSYDSQIEEARGTLTGREFTAKKAELERQFEARRRAIGDDTNNPLGYLKTPIAELDDANARIVNGDYTRHQVEKLERTLRGQTVAGLADQVGKLDRHFEYMLDHQGIVGGGANWMKNHVGRDGGWIVDSNLGSDAVERTIRDAHVAADRVRGLEDFRGTNAEFLDAYRDRVGGLHDSLRGVERHIGKFERSQENWVEGVSTAASVVGAAAAAAATGGTAAPLLVGALAGASLKVGVKGADAITGGHDYQGSVGVDLLKGGLNGVSAAGTGMLAQQASKRLLASATGRLAAGETLGLGTRGGVWLGTAAGEGALDGYIAGTGNALIDGKSFSDANAEGLQGLALGAALGPVARGSMEGLGFLWKSAARPSGLPRDVAVDWRGRPIDDNGALLPMKRDWRGRWKLDETPAPTTPARPDGPPPRGLDDTDLEIPVRKLAPIDEPPKPYEALPPATGRPTAENLTARVDGYNQVHDPNFTTGMANAIGEAETSLRNIAEANGGKVTPAQVDEVLKQIGVRRRELQHAKVDRDAASAAAAGKPWTPDELQKAHAHADMYGAPLPAMRAPGGNQMVDQVLRNNRHAAYVERADEAMRNLEANGFETALTLDVGGVPTRVPLSGVMRNPWHPGGYLTVHPDFDQSRLLANRGYELMAEVMNDTALTEAQAFRKMGEANYLMMHGTPFQLGSPASIEALNDAVMRARFGKTIPQKRPGVEPFWEAMFAPPGVAGRDRFADVYRQFFE